MDGEKNDSPGSESFNKVYQTVGLVSTAMGVKDSPVYHTTVSTIENYNIHATSMKRIVLIVDLDVGTAILSIILPFTPDIDSNISSPSSSSLSSPSLRPSSTWTTDTDTNNTGAFSSRSAHCFVPSSRALVANECQATSDAIVQFTLHTKSSKQSFDVDFPI